MNIFKKPLIVIATALCIAPMAGFAQYQFELKPFLSYFKDAKRYELSFNYIVPQATFNGTSQVKNGTYLGDTTIKRNTTGTGLGGSIGLTLPFKATGHISCWAMSLHLSVNQYTWTDLNSTYGPDLSVVNPTSNSLSATTLQVALPIGIDWLVGNHAIDTKRLPLGAAFGVGLMPSINSTSLSGVSVDGLKSSIAFGCTPYVKAEASFYIGFDVKIRAMYTTGGAINLMNVYRAIPNYTDGPFRVVSTGNLLLSFVIMPFSGGWKETNWWNTYDTYNKHDRFN